MAWMANPIGSPIGLEVVMVMTPSARREVEMRSEPRRTKSQIRSCLLIAWLSS